MHPRNNEYVSDLWDLKCDFSDIQGKTIQGFWIDSSGALWIGASDQLFVMLHERDCCEGADIEQVDGDPGDLVGSVALLAEKSSSIDDPPVDAESFTWTFYKISTQAGDLIIRWLGISNGYYSEDVSFYRWPDGALPPDAVMWVPR